MPPRLPFQRYLKPVFHKPLPHIACPAQAHAGPFRYCFIGIPFVSKEQCQCPLAFSRAVFPPVKDVMEQVFFIPCQRYLVFIPFSLLFSNHNYNSVWIVAVAEAEPPTGGEA
jgi:hypothetical protein